MQCGLFASNFSGLLSLSPSLTSGSMSAISTKSHRQIFSANFADTGELPAPTYTPWIHVSSTADCCEPQCNHTSDVSTVEMVVAVDVPALSGACRCHPHTYHSSPDSDTVDGATYKAIRYLEAI